MDWNKQSLAEKPTLHQGQCCDCKVDTGDIRVWLCRVGGGVSIEQYQPDTGRWEIISGSCEAEPH